MHTSIQGKFLLSLAILCLFSCRSTNYLSSIKPERQTISTKIEADQSITALIQPYKVKLDEKMNQVIGQTATDLTKKRPESTLGNFMADAIQRQTEKNIGESIAFAIQNYGGIRISKIAKGAITRGKIYELMPFDNTVVILSLNRTEVMELVEHLTSGGGWPVSSTIQINQNDSGKLDIQIRDQPLSPDKIYKVAIPDYVANGGSDSKFLRGKPQQALDLYIRDLLITDVEEHTANKLPIESKIDGRLVLKKD